MTLSRKRWRGTLQDYEKEKISKCQSKPWTNRNVFSWCPNGTREETVRRDGGGLFHARGILISALFNSLATLLCNIHNVIRDIYLHTNLH